MPDQPTRGEPAWRAKLRGSWLGNLVVIGVTALAIGIGWWVMRPDPAENQVSDVEVAGVQPAPQVGEAAPGFTATATNGEEVSLDALSGRPVWLVFMATWCSACRAEMPDVPAASEAAGPDGVEVIAIFVGEGASVIGPYANRLGLTMTQVPDVATDLSAAYGVMGVPAHYFIDGDGIVQHTWVGVLSPTQMDEAITTSR